MGGWHSPGLELLSTPLSHVLASQSALEPAMVVIDSWDALVERMTPDPSPTNGVLSVRQLLDRTIIDRFSATGTLLTIVVEREERTELDYLVDAVVTTRLETPDERVERWLSLSKLRGVRIGNPQYPFTLEGGKFRCLTPTRSDLRVLEARPAADPSPAVTGLWPGNPTFAGCFGRLPWNGVSLLELSSHTPDELTRTFTWTAGVHVVSEGGRVFAILPPTMSTVALWDALKTWVEPGHFCKHTRLLAAVDPSEYPTEIADSAVRTTDWKVSAPDATGAPSRSGSVGPNLPGIHRFLRDSGDMGRPVLVIVYLEGLELAGRLVGVDYAPSSFPALVQAYSRIPQSHVMVVGRTGRSPSRIDQAACGGQCPVQRKARPGLLLRGPTPDPYLRADGGPRGARIDASRSARGRLRDAPPVAVPISPESMFAPGNATRGSNRMRAPSSGRRACR